MKILIIEDDNKISEYLAESLHSEMFAVDTASDGETGSYLARVNEYDLIILDIMLPKKDGFEICTEVRESGKTVPILIISAMGTPEEKTKMLNAGADDYLAKPFEIQELVARVRALLRRPTQIVGEFLEVRDLTLDSAKNIVTKDGIEITLTRKEFMLLQYLMQNPDIVLTRAMILEHVWDMDIDIFSNTIEAHILSLRKKISDTNKQDPIIKTVPSRGYKIVT